MSIILGRMNISSNKWDQNFTKDDCYQELDPDEIVINKQEISINYTFPLTNQEQITYETTGGFTRKDLSKIIMKEYKLIYDQEERTFTNVDALDFNYNRLKSNGYYGIWGYHLHELYLHSLTKEEDGSYSIGIDPV